MIFSAITKRYSQISPEPHTEAAASPSGETSEYCEAPLWRLYAEPLKDWERLAVLAHHTLMAEPDVAY